MKVLKLLLLSPMTQKMTRISSYLLEALASLMMIHILETFSANIRYFATTQGCWKFTFKIEAAMKIFPTKMPKAIPQIRSKALLVGKMDHLIVAQLKFTVQSKVMNMRILQFLST